VRAPGDCLGCELREYCGDRILDRPEHGPSFRFGSEGAQRNSIRNYLSPRGKQHGVLQCALSALRAVFAASPSSLELLL